MWKQKIGISLARNYSVPMAEIIKIIAATGFDAVSPNYGSEISIEQICAEARSLGLAVEFLHAPFTKSADMWCDNSELRAAAMKDIIAAIDECEMNGIPTVVAHTWIGFDTECVPTEEGFDSFDKVVAAAERAGVKLALENTEGDGYLHALMERYRERDSVGFCWDSGHEMCYNHSEDLLALYGDRLLVTHLNDNLGISRFDGETFWTDDLHLLPYDGIADWDYNVERLRRSQRLDILNFELGLNSKPGRHDNDKYTDMSYEQYFAEAYARACRIAYKYSK